jgi:hypothetical protein
LLTLTPTGPIDIDETMSASRLLRHSLQYRRRPPSTTSSRASLARSGPPTAGAAGGRSGLLSNVTPRRLGWQGLGGGLHGNGAEFSRFRGFCGLPSTVTAATSISADALARRSSGRPRPARLERVLRAVSAHLLFPSSARCYGRHGVDRPASRHAGLRSLLPRPPQRSMEARPCSSQ